MLRTFNCLFDATRRKEAPVQEYIGNKKKRRYSRVRRAGYVSKSCPFSPQKVYRGRGATLGPKTLPSLVFTVKLCSQLRERQTLKIKTQRARRPVHSKKRI